MDGCEKFNKEKLPERKELYNNDDERKKRKGIKMCVVKRNLKFKHFKICVKAFQIVNKIKYLEKKGIFVDSQENKK